MRHALFLVLALGLAACTVNKAAPDAPAEAAALSPVAVDAGGIEVTPLASPAGAEAAAPAEPASADSASASADATDTAEAVPVSEADAATPRPEPRADPADGEVAPEVAESDVVEEPPPPPPKSQLQLTCEAANGVWGQSGNVGGFLCQKRTRDGGKSCRKKDDCAGECLAPSQTCSPVMPLMGCNDVLDGQGRRMTLCLE